MTFIWCMVYEIGSVTNRTFCHFRLSLLFYLPNNPKNQNFKKIQKTTWRYYHFSHVYHKWESYEIRFLRYQPWRTYFFVILDHFLSFYSPPPPLTTKKIKILNNWKKPWRYFHFTHKYHKWHSYHVRFLRYEVWQTEFFVILDHFLHFYPLTTQKINILKNWKKKAWRYDHIIC